MNQMSDDYLRAFVGARVTGFGVSEDGFPFLLAAFPPDGKGEVRVKIEISRDPEGNGPGFLFLSEAKATEPGTRS